MFLVLYWFTSIPYPFPIVQVNRWNGERVVLEGDATGRVVAASVCEELRLPAVRALTDKVGLTLVIRRSLGFFPKL